MHQPRVFFLAVLFLHLTVAISLAQESTRQPAPRVKDAPEVVSNEVLIKLKPGSRPIQSRIQSDAFRITPQTAQTESLPASIRQIQDKHQIQAIEKINKRALPSDQTRIKDLDTVYTVRFSESEVPLAEVIKQFNQDPAIEAAYPNHIFTLTQVPNDPYYLDQYPDNISNRLPIWNPLHDYQWNLKTISMQAVWDLDLPEVKVAVIDSGIDYTHPELGNCTLEMVNTGQCPKVLPGIDLINNDNDPMDDNNHGTHVSGIIAALTNNNLGIAGMSQNARIIPIKVFDPQGRSYEDDILAAINEAVLRGAKVINASWGGPGTSPILEAAFRSAYEQGVTIVTAAGNNTFDTSTFYPASFTCKTPADPKRDCTITVGATDTREVRASYSNWGADLDVSAPGGLDNEVLSLKSASGLADNNASYGYLRAAGTSMAAPHVSALAAIVLGAHPEFTPQQVYNSIVNATRDLGDPGFDALYGAGIINVDETVLTPNTNDVLEARISYPYPNFLTSPQFELRGSSFGPQFDHYIVEYAQQDATNWTTNGVTLLNNGRTPIIHGNLVSVNLPSIASGTYNFRLTTFAKDGTTSHSIQPVAIDFQVKPGFPIEFGSSLEQKTVFADVNQDGVDELIFTNGTHGMIDVLTKNGFSLPGWPKFTGELESNGYQPNFITVSDFDPSYPGLEIIVPVSYSGMGNQLIIFHADGTSVPNWSINDWTPSEYVGLTTNVSTTIINNQAVIIYAEMLPVNTSQPMRIHMYNIQRQELPGWPVELPMVSAGERNDFFILSPPHTADMNRDGSPEIVVVYNLNKLKIYSATGQLQADITLPPSELIGETFGEYVQIADVTGDTNLEIVGVADISEDSLDPRTGKIYVWDHLGNNASPAWPVTVVLPTEFPPPARTQSLSVGDFNHDGRTDIFITATGNSYSGGMYYVFDGSAQVLPGFPFRGSHVIDDAINLTQIDNNHFWLNTSFDEVYMFIYNPFTATINKLSQFDKAFKLFPDMLQAFAGSPAIGQFDSDPELELSVNVQYGISSSSGQTYLYVFDLPIVPKQLDWPQYFQNHERTGALINLTINFDINGDGSVNLADLKELIGRLFDHETGIDFNLDGVSSAFDFAVFRNYLLTN